MGVDLGAGVRLGDFKILKLLGAGGDGTVYQARQVSLGRDVALKVLGQSLRGAADKARFRRQAQAVARLRHPNIAEVYCVSQDEDYCYMAMRHVEGYTLRQILDRAVSSTVAIPSFDALLRTEFTPSDGAHEIRFDASSDSDDDLLLIETDQPEKELITPQAWQFLESADYVRRCCAIIEEAALALDYAHEQGVIHRDIKPENLMLDRDGSVHLIDFGIARFLDDISLSSTGALVGTPTYMSPEQIAGRVNIDRRSDVYSLGIVLYELLTVGRPFTGPTREAVLRQIATKAVPPAGVRNRAVPRNLEAIVHKAITRDPDERYQTAALFARDIRNFLDGHLVEARPYRYKFDHRNVVGERPIRITIVSFVNFTFAVICLPILALILARVLPSNSPFYSINFVVILVIITLLNFFIAIGLLFARKAAIFAGVVSYLFVSAVACLVAYNNSVNKLPIEPFGVVLDIYLLIAGISALYLLCSRKSRSWYRYAQTLHTEHRESAKARHASHVRAPLIVPGRGRNA